MKIYIASSWKNQHAVEMLSRLLREAGHEVLSFVENNFGEGETYKKSQPFDEWCWAEGGKKAFEYDTTGATKAHCVIYLGPSGVDAWAEVGAAWASKRPIIGLHAKGEQVGLMRRMITTWCRTYLEVLEQVKNVEEEYKLYG